MDRYVLYSLIFGFGFGVFISSYQEIGNTYFLILFFSTLVILFSGFFFVKNKNIHIYASIFILSFILGAVRLQYYNLSKEHNFDGSLGESISLQGFYVDQSSSTASQRFVFEEKNTKQKILVSTDMYPRYSFGNLLQVEGKLQSPQNFLTEQGKTFDYISYLSKDDIFYIMQNANVSFLSHENIYPIRGFLFRMKNRFIENISNAVPGDPGEFLSGVSLGASGNMSKSLKDSFVKTGTIHVVALSGYNISVVAKSVESLFSYFFSFYASLFLGAFSIVLFVLMTGAQSTAIRAGIMALLVVLSKSGGRTYDVKRALFIAGFLMILWNPLVLTKDISFQLSFIATMGIIFLNPILDHYFGKKPNEKPASSFFLKIKRGFRDMLSTTLSAQVAVLPFIVYKMGIFSLLSFPINIIILPFIPVLMYLGFFISILGFLGSVFILPFSFLSTILIKIVLFVVERGSSLPYSYTYVYNFPIYLVLFFYTLIIFFVYKKRDFLSQ